MTDSNRKYRPTTFRISRWGFELLFQFPMIKLIDYQEKWEQLEQNPNPFSIAVMAFLKTVETIGRELERWFLIELYDKGLTRDTIFSLYQFIDIVMKISKELDIGLTEELAAIEEDRKMAIITSAERLGIKKGRREGKIEGLHESINDIFEIKFGRNIYELFAQLKQIQDIEILQQIRHGLIKAQTLEETKNLILLQISNWQKN